MKKRIFMILAGLILGGITGCVSYNYTQAVRNETGFTITEVYIRDTGTNDWGSVRNVQARTNSEGQILYRQDGSVVYDRVNVNNATQIVLFRESGSSETPRAVRNKDIVVVDSNGFRYMKQNIPITFTVSKYTYQVLTESNEVISSTEPITFTVQDRLPMLFVVNQTGYPISLMAPYQANINNQARAQFQPMEMNRSIDVVYRIGTAQYTEQVTLRNEDTTVTLTKRPPTLTIVNNVGATINFIFLRIPGSPTWVGGNIVTRNGVVHLASSAQTGDISGSIVNRDSMRIWLGNISIEGDTFDIRIDDVNGNSYVKSNVRVPNDMSLTFTASDRR